MTLLRFLEKIDCQCSNFPDQSINKKALRMDGKGKEGLREQLGIGNSCNCCDYLLPERNKIIFIEISDLLAQLHDIKQKYKKTPKDLKTFLKEPKQYVNRELKLKLYGSLIVLFKIPMTFNIKHEKIHRKELEVIFILCSNNVDDILAFEYLQVDISNALKPLLKKVKIINLPMANKLFEKNVITKKL